VTTPLYVHDLLDLLMRVTNRLDFGGHPVPDDVQKRLLDHTARPVPGVVKGPLTIREAEVLRGMASGLSNREIGDGMYLTEDTVKTHASRLFRKLGARDRAHAVAVGFRSGLLR
jgi:DNA-binding NarL/FixJ family response regulator